MDKKEQVKFLKTQLDISIKSYLINEPRYRALESKILAGGFKNQAILIEETKSKLTKDMLQNEIRNIRGLIAEIEREEFIV